MGGGPRTAAQRRGRGARAMAGEVSYGGATAGRGGTNTDGGSERADMERALESHPCAKWGLMIVNGIILMLGIVLLVFCGLMLSEGSGTSTSVAPIGVIGCGMFFVGVIGVWSSFAHGDVDKKCGLRVLKFYWWALFFGTIFAAWVFAYCVINFDKIEDEVMHHFEENWNELIKDFPDEYLAKIPQSCGGTKVNLCEFSVDGSSTTGFADPADPTDEEEAACEASVMDTEEGEDSVICVYHEPYTLEAMCVGADDAGEACDYTCTEEACCPAPCEYFAEEEEDAQCVEITIETDESSGRRLTEEYDPFTLGSSADFEAQCWSTIKDTLMSNIEIVGIVMLVVVLLCLCCMYWCIALLTPRTAISIVRKTIDYGMTFVGLLVFVLGVYMAATLDFEETMLLTLPLIILGLFMLFLGVAFGCFSDRVECCAKYAWMVYSFLFVVMIALAVGAIVQEDAVRDNVLENGDAWLEKFCDTTCYSEIEAKMKISRTTEECADPPAGDSECAASYVWAADKHLDIACNSTAPNTISQVCECPCAEAQALADVKEATDEFIITSIMSSVNTIGWLCILIAIYLLIEVLSHLYSHSRHWDVNAEVPDAADKPASA